MRILEISLGSESAATELWEGEIVRVDPVEGAGGDVQADPRELPEDLGIFDIILAHNVLQYLPRPNLIPMLRAWRDHLADNGELHLIVPDLMWAIEKVMEEQDVTQLTLSEIYGPQDREYGFQLMGFSMPLLRAIVEAGGFIAKKARSGPRLLNWGEDESGVKKGEIGRQLYILAVKDDSTRSWLREFTENPVMA